MNNTYTRAELEAWCKHLIGKQCPLHPNKLIKDGKWGLWCGEKDEWATWCSGGGISQEFLTNLRNNPKGQSNA